MARTAGLSSSCRSALTISARRLTILGLGKRRVAHDVDDDRQHVVEVFREARAGHRQGVRVALTTRSETPRSSSSSAMTSADRARRAAIEDAAGQEGDAGFADRLVRRRRPATVAVIVTAGVIARLLHDDDGAVVEHRAGRREAARTVASGHASLARRHLSARTSRPSGDVADSRRRATSAHLFGRDRVDACLQLGQEPGAGDRLEVSELMRDVGDAVVLEHEARPQLTPGAHHLLVGDTSRRRARSIASSTADFDRGSVTPCIAVSDSV